MSYRRRQPRRLTDDERALWQQVARQVTPLRTVEIEVEPVEPDRPTSPPPPPSTPRKRRPDLTPLPAVAPSPIVRPTTPMIAERTHGDTAGIDRRTATRFLRGNMQIDGRLDLHGMTRERAHSALVGFLRRAHERGDRCVLVITGKGNRRPNTNPYESREGPGILRQDVPHWLNQAPLRSMVLSFAHATPRDGGEGALYVLLKRQR